MMRFLRYLTPITGGDLRKILTRERLQAIQGAIIALANGEHISTSGEIKRGLGDGRLRLDVRRKARSYGGGTSSGPCYFGEVISIDDETEYTRGIRGGVVFAGDKIWHVPYQGINTDADSDSLVWLKLEVEANADSTLSVSLSGLKTSGPAPVWENGDVSSGYPDIEIPPMECEGVQPAGEIIIPIGRLRVVGGTATLERTGCGNFFVGHCPGNLYALRTSEMGSSGSV